MDTAGLGTAPSGVETGPSGPSRASEAIGLILTLGYVGYCVYVIWVQAGRPPIMPRVWHTTMRALQGLAALFGRAGIAAEAAYGRAVAGTSLAD